jgi:hypothetical protein
VAKVKVRDDAIWVKHIEGDPRLGDKISGLRAGQVIDLEIDGIVGRWEKMRDGRDGRPTSGIKPIEAMREVWARFRREPERIVDVREVRTADSYLAMLDMTLSEWDSPEDEAAYRDLPVR